MMLDICGGAIQQAIVPDRLRSRVSGAYMVVNSAFARSALSWRCARSLGRTAAHALDRRVGGLAGVLFLIPSPIPRMRDLPATEEPDEQAAGKVVAVS